MHIANHQYTGTHQFSCSEFFLQQAREAGLLAWMNSFPQTKQVTLVTCYAKNIRH